MTATPRGVAGPPGAGSGGAERPRVGLILGGGGARAAYQVGVLKAVRELLPRDARNPFPVICGTSAGAINATALAAGALRLPAAIDSLVGVWENFQVEMVFRADPLTVFTRGGRWVLALLLGGLGRHNPPSLLDNAPLRGLLERHIPLVQIRHAIDHGALNALCVTACSYTNGSSVSFFEDGGGFPQWQRSRRLGVRTRISLDHLMASSAIPIIFPGVRIGDEYYGDGGMRQSAPLSPALHLGADRLLIIGLRHDAPEEAPPEDLARGHPSIGQIAGYILDTLFLDSLDADLERLERLNSTLGLVPETVAQSGEAALRRIDTLVIQPSEDIAAMASQHRDSLPGTVRMLLRGIGADRPQGRRLLGYLLFERPFCRAVIDLGYRDAMARRTELASFLGLETPAPGSGSI